MRITYIGHATLLLELGGRRILTDPNFDASLAGILRRVAPPGIAIDRLPRLDAILVTHAHADHLSFASLDLLPRDIPLLAPPAIARWLDRLGYHHAEPIAADGDAHVGPVRVHAAAAAHEGHRYGLDRWRGATNMYLLDDGAESIFFAGDTALRDDTHAVVDRTLLGGRTLDVALLPIGYAPRWKAASFRKGHLTAEDALTLFERTGARAFIPYHWGTFNHVTSGAHDAIVRLRAMLPAHRLRERVHVLEPGEHLELAPSSP